MKKIAVVFFPGMNCEVETARVIRKSGLNPEIFLWNDNSNKLSKFDGFVFPGGFSFEDRGRSGVIASFEPALDKIRIEAKKGKAIFGICNGAQIIAESGLLGIPIALAPNLQIEDGNIRSTGYFNEWVYLKNSSNKKTPFNNFTLNKVIHVPIAHGEGRFVSESDISEEDILFKYTDIKGKEISEFPINPNGTKNNAAAISNKEGNVCAMMPHPERSKEGIIIFESLSKWLSDNKNYKSTEIRKNPEKIELKNHSEFDIEFFVSLKITDNTRWTIENTLRKNGFPDVELKRFEWWGFTLPKGEDIKKYIKNIVIKGEAVNLHREILRVKIKNKIFKFSENGDLEEDINFSKGFFIKEKIDIKGKSALQNLNRKSINPKNVSRGIYWQVISKKEKIQDLVNSGIFLNSEYAFAEV